MAWVAGWAVGEGYQEGLCNEAYCGALQALLVLRALKKHRVITHKNFRNGSQ